MDHVCYFFLLLRKLGASVVCSGLANGQLLDEIRN